MNMIAIANGWTGWSEYCTAVIKGLADMPPKILDDGYFTPEECKQGNHRDTEDGKCLWCGGGSN